MWRTTQSDTLFNQSVDSVCFFEEKTNAVLYILKYSVWRKPHFWFLLVFSLKTSMCITVNGRLVNIVKVWCLAAQVVTPVQPLGSISSSGWKHQTFTPFITWMKPMTSPHWGQLNSTRNIFREVYFDAEHWDSGSRFNFNLETESGSKLCILVVSLPARATCSKTEISSMSLVWHLNAWTRVYQNQHMAKETVFPASQQVFHSGVFT